MKKKPKDKIRKIVDDTVVLPRREGNGILKYTASVDNKNRLTRFSFAYINHNICTVDNGRVLGFDNCHGYPHRHFMGKESDIEFINYEQIADRFESEWRDLHEKQQKASKK